ncbi:MAG: energy-coupling factor transporter transmembrane protein EcfT [Tissierellia bacterium]|nr:energy-coupling factor transporter transmembrane protein EcfT [Tissierellia bacterium]
MLKDITIGQYFPGTTLVHKLDPRVKITIAIMFIISLFFVDKFIVFLLPFAYVITTIVVSRLPIKIILKGIKPLRWIILITFIINVIFTKGEPLFQIGSFVVSKNGVVEASFLAIRLLLLIMGASLLTLTTSPISLTDGIESLFNPLAKIGFPAHELAMMMTIALRFIPTLLEETDKIMKAQTARGADFESGNIVKRAMNLVPLLVPLFINAFRRADDLAVAMEARCYRGAEGRTKLHELNMEKSDYIVLAIGFLFFGLIIATRYILK